MIPNEPLIGPELGIRPADLGNPDNAWLLEAGAMTAMVIVVVPAGNDNAHSITATGVATFTRQTIALGHLPLGQPSTLTADTWPDAEALIDANRQLVAGVADIGQNTAHLAELEQLAARWASTPDPRLVIAALVVLPGAAASRPDLDVVAATLIEPGPGAA